MKQDALLEKIFDYVDSMITEKIIISDLSNKVNYSVYHFCRSFSEQTGMSPMRYITLRKLQFAVYDIAMGGKVIDVAFKYGFETPEGFTKAFRSHFGYPPTKFLLPDKISYPKKMNITYLNESMGGSVMTSQPIQKGALKTILKVNEKGVRKKIKIPGHAMGFPALMTAMKIFLGLSPRIKICERENITFLWDLDYYFHLAVSTEGFGLFYDLPQAVIAHNYFNGEPLKDCFNAEGIKYRLLSGDNIASKDEALNPETIDSVIYDHLKKDLPVIIFYQANLYLFVTGICENNMQLLAYPFADGSTKNKAYEMQKNSRLYQNWKDNIGEVILIDGICEPCSRREIIIKALKRGYEMLTETKPTFFDYGYGDNLYKNWIGFLENDSNFKTKKE
jgi:AraC-like DNA-binding protein